VRVLLEFSFCKHSLPLRFLVNNLATKFVVTFDQLEPQRLHSLTSSRLAQAGLLERLEGLFALILLASKSLKATMTLGGLCGGGSYSLSLNGSTVLKKEGMEPVVELLDELVGRCASDLACSEDLG